jgi:hypothetical protein
LKLNPFVLHYENADKRYICLASPTAISGKDGHFDGYQYRWGGPVEAYVA